MPGPAVVTVFDDLFDSQGSPMANTTVHIRLNTNQATSITPLTILSPTQVTVTTDSAGHWTTTLVPNTNISPANTLYNVTTPLYSYDITVGAAGPYQSTAVGTIVNTPQALSAATSSITGPLTVAGALVGQSTLAITGTTTLTGALTASATSDFVGIAQFDTSARFHGPDPWYDVMHPTFAATGNGVTNDTTAIQAAIDAASAGGGGTVFFPPGTYVVDFLALKSKVTLQGAGAGSSILKQLSDTAGHHTVTSAAGGTTDIAVRDLGFTGVGIGGGNTYGIVFGYTLVASVGTGTPVTRGRIEHCTFTGYSAGGIQVGAPQNSSAGIVSDFAIKDCSFVDNAVAVGQPTGIAVTNGQRGVIDSCYIEKSGADRSFSGSNGGIDFETNAVGDVIQDIVVSNTRIRNSGNGIVMSGSSTDYQTKNIVIANCELWGHLNQGLGLGTTSKLLAGIVVGNCNIHDNGSIGVGIAASNTIISNCQIVDNNQSAAGLGHINISTTIVNTTITGCRIGYVQFAGNATPIVLENASCDYTLISDCDVRIGAGTSLPTFTLIGTHSKVVNCVGFPDTDVSNTQRFRYEPVGVVGTGTTVVGTGAVAAIGFTRGQSMSTGVTNPSSAGQRITMGTSVGPIGRLRTFTVAGSLADTLANSNAYWYMTDENVDVAPAGTNRHIGIKNLNGTVSFTTADGTTEQLTTITGSVAGGSFHVFVMTYDGVTARLFIDGVLTATHSTNVPTGTNQGILRLYINNNNTANARTSTVHAVDVQFAAS